MMQRPYFMENEEWYYFDENGYKEHGSNYLLTEKGKSIPEVVESYNEFLGDDEIGGIDFDAENDEEEAMRLFGLEKKNATEA